MISYKGQRWVLLGTASASEEVFGLKPIEFPCGYSIPHIAYADGDNALHYPKAKGDVWALAGFAMEVSRKGKNVPEEKALEHIAGYRPWLCLYYPVVLDELESKQHTVTIWDQGVCLFYALWREAGQALGDIISTDVYDELFDKPISIIVDGVAKQGEAASAYAHSGEKIIGFMTRFMTLSEGDIYVMGPLVAQKVAIEAQAIAMEIGDMIFERKITPCP